MMTSEHIFLNGTPVVGFGDDGLGPDLEFETAMISTMLGFTAGAVGGAVLGNKIKKGFVGIASGGVVGAFVGATTAAIAIAAVQR
jgi:hypothetical protein